MSYKKLALFLACFAALPLFGDAGSQSSDIDKQIAKLRDERVQATRNAYLASRKADQFLGENWVDYQRAITEEERYEAKIKELDKKIAELEKQKR